METPTKDAKLEVTGVSRSGRVRKKSSKLMDFQSPDDFEPKSKKAKQLRAAAKLANKRRSSEHGDPATASKSDDEDAESDEFPANPELSDSDAELDDDDDLLEDADDGGIDPTVRQSLYMTEKSNKKKILKDGKIVYGKAQRKDKGKSRFTAYMLWAKDVRKQVLKNQQDMDFVALSKKLGEMWANVPRNEKVIWRRRAKRLATKTKKTLLKESTKPITAADTNSKVSSSTFLNRATTSRTKKIAQAQMTPTKVQKAVKEASVSPLQIFSNATKLSGVSTQPGVFKVTGVEPLDVAAHLQLLGESLTIIGERLKEHEGQITVSGSLSVLMDSLLCSIGPLLCLTTRIPGFDANKQLKDNLHKILDNIAYVMPGL